MTLFLALVALALFFAWLVARTERDTLQRYNKDCESYIDQLEEYLDEDEQVTVTSVLHGVSHSYTGPAYLAEQWGFVAPPV